MNFLDIHKSNLLVVVRTQNEDLHGENLNIRIVYRVVTGIVSQ